MHTSPALRHKYGTTRNDSGYSGKKALHIYSKLYVTLQFKLFNNDIAMVIVSIVYNVFNDFEFELDSGFINDNTNNVNEIVL